MEFLSPYSLKLEHEELYAELVRLTQGSGEGGCPQTASALRKEAGVHNVAFGAPSALVAEGKIIPEMREAIQMMDRLKADLHEMLSEYKVIVETLENLKTAAKAEGKKNAAHFTEKLVLHAKTEEEVLCLASIFVGEYLKIKLSSSECIGDLLV